jgi:hypothetical protein
MYDSGFQFFSIVEGNHAQIGLRPLAANISKKLRWH